MIKLLLSFSLLFPSFCQAAGSQPGTSPTDAERRARSPLPPRSPVMATAPFTLLPTRAGEMFRYVQVSDELNAALRRQTALRERERERDRALLDQGSDVVPPADSSKRGAVRRLSYKNDQEGRKKARVKEKARSLLDQESDVVDEGVITLVFQEPTEEDKQ